MRSPQKSLRVRTVLEGEDNVKREFKILRAECQVSNESLFVPPIKELAMTYRHDHKIHRHNVKDACMMSKATLQILKAFSGMAAVILKSIDFGLTSRQTSVPFAAERQDQLHKKDTRERLT